jgi:hypothetical protein
MADPYLTATLEDLTRLAEPFDFTDGLGETLRTIAAEEISANMEQQCDSDGETWAPLSDYYRAWKDVHAPGLPMAILTGTMWTAEQLMGTVGIDQLKMRHAYGTDPIAISHAIDFQEGDPTTNQPPRPFWGFTARAFERMNEQCDLKFTRAVA